MKHYITLQPEQEWAITKDTNPQNPQISPQIYNSLNVTTRPHTSLAHPQKDFKAS